MNATDLIRITTTGADGKGTVCTATWAAFVEANFDLDDLASITEVLSLGGKVTLGGEAAPVTELRAV